MSDDERFGLGKGKAYPASAAKHLLNPLRKFIHPPSRLARRARIFAGDRVLELGCGPGWFSPSLAARAGTLVLADLQTQMLKLARDRAPSAKPSAANGLALPFASKSLDVVVLAAVLGEIPDPPKALEEIARVLRTGGKLAVLETRTDPDFTSFKKLSAMAAPAGLRPAVRHGRVAGYTAVFAKAA